MTKKFEYNYTHAGKVGTDGLAEHLDNLGGIGWELVQIVDNVYFFKREMTEHACDNYEYTFLDVPNEGPVWLHSEELTKCGANGWAVVKADVTRDNDSKYVMRYLLMRKVPVEGMSNTHNKAGEYIGDNDYNPPKGFVGHVIEGPSIAESNLIPPGIYFRSGNFYDVKNDNKGMGIPFYDKWKSRATEFPPGPAEAIEALAIKDKSEVFDYTYFFSPQHVWIKGNKIAIMSFINQCWNRNVWFNYYPNVSNKEFPWLIVKSGMKNEIVAHAERYGMCIEVIPGEHMTEDKL